MMFIYGAERGIDMSGADIGILVVVAIAAGLVIQRSYKRRKNGESGCGCGCSGCSKEKLCKGK